MQGSDLKERLRAGRFIKAGYVWEYQALEWVSGHVAIRRARWFETLMYRWFKREPRP